MLDRPAGAAVAIARYLPNTGLGKALRRLTAFVQFGFTVALLLTLASERTSAGISQKCLDAASLWMPAEAAADLAVSKWSEAKLGYTVIQHDDRISDLIEKSLKAQSQAAGMTLSAASGFGIDIFAAAVPDILRFATPAGRDTVANYFQDFHRRTNTEGAVDIDPASWEARFRNIEPKCLGSTLRHEHAILRAFIAIQQDESEACVNIGLGEVLGLGNIRRYYAAHGQNVPPDLIVAGLQTLYDKRIVAGMSRSAAINEVEGICNE